MKEVRSYFPKSLLRLLAVLMFVVFGCFAFLLFRLSRGWTTTLQSIQVRDDIVLAVRQRHPGGLSSLVDEGSQGYVFVEARIGGRTFETDGVFICGPMWSFEPLSSSIVRLESQEFVVAIDSGDPRIVVAAFSIDGTHVLPDSEAGQSGREVLARLGMRVKEGDPKGSMIND